MKTNTRCTILLVFAMFFIRVEIALAAATSAEQAKEVVVGWLKSNPRPLGEATGQATGSIDTFKDDTGASLYYVVNIKPTGFVVISADDRIEPIIAFSLKGKYDASNSTPLGALVNRDLRSRVIALRSQSANRSVASPEATPPQKKWAALTNTNAGGAEFRGTGVLTDIRIAPLVQSLWSQENVSGNACYNYYTPNGPSGNPNNFVCGCVATAMAQLMRYYQYPASPNNTGPLPYQITGTPQPPVNLLGGNGSGGPYNWSLMELDPASNGVTATQSQAIGALCFDAGISVNMNYAFTGQNTNLIESGAFVSNVPSALRNSFRFKNAVYGRALNGTTLPDGLVSMINPNLDAGLPVLFGINGPPGGHCILCDGYGYNSGTFYHHLNLGWSGNGDILWYNLPNIDATSLVAGAQFTTVNDCAYNIFKTGSGEIISSRVVDTQRNPVNGATVTATMSNGTTFTTTTSAQGIYAFAGIPSNSTYTIAVSASGLSYPAQTVTTGTSADNASASGNQWFPTIFGPTSAIGVVGTPFNFTISASNLPNIFAATGLPLGLSLDSNAGTISGTPLLPIDAPVNVTISASTATSTGTPGGTSSTTFTVFPILRFTSPLTATPSPAVVGQPITFTCFPNIPDAAITWDFGDGNPSTGNAITHTYSAAGQYSITATANHSLTNQTLQTVTVKLLVESAINLVQPTFAPKRKFSVAFPSKTKDTFDISLSSLTSNGNLVPQNFGYSSLSSKDFASKTDGLKLQIFLGDFDNAFDITTITKGKGKSQTKNASLQWNYKKQTIRYQLRNSNLVSLLQPLGVDSTTTLNPNVMIPFFVDIKGVRFGGAFKFFYTANRGRGKGISF